MDGNECLVVEYLSDKEREQFHLEFIASTIAKNLEDYFHSYEYYEEREKQIRKYNTGFIKDGDKLLSKKGI